MQEKIQFIYFDLGNVLVTFSHEVMLQQLANVSRVPAADVRHIVFDQGLQYAYETGKISTGEFCQEFCRRLGCDAEHDDLLQAASNIFQINSSMLPILQQLHTQGFGFGILSNTCEAHWNWITTRFPIVPQLSGMNVLSFEVGAVKPEIEIYQHAIQRSGVRASEIFFTDDRDDNVAGAAAAGMIARRFESASKLARALRECGIELNLG